MKAFLFAICILSSSLAFGKGGNGDEVRNGGGLAENYLTFALKNLDHSLKLCFDSQRCATKAEDRKILLKIKEALPLEIKSNILKFASEKKNPGFFKINGITRLAITGNTVGSPIYYNLDMLYKNDESQINYGQAVQSLIHELGHHHAVYDHDRLENLGAEVRASEYETQMCRVTSGYFCPEGEDTMTEWLCQNCSTMQAPANDPTKSPWSFVGGSCYHRKISQLCQDKVISEGILCMNGMKVKWQCRIDNPGSPWVPQGDGCYRAETKEKCE